MTEVWIDQRSHAIHAEMVQITGETVELLDVAKATLQRWLKRYEPDAPLALLEWDAILKNSTTREVLPDPVGRGSSPASSIQTILRNPPRRTAVGHIRRI